MSERAVGMSEVFGRYLFDLIKELSCSGAVNALQDSILLERAVSISQCDVGDAEVVMRRCVIGLVANG